MNRRHHPDGMIHLSLMSGGRIDVDLRPVYSAGLQHAGFPLVVDVRAIPAGGEILRARLEIESLSAGISIEAIGTESRVSTDSALRTALEALSGTHRSRIHLSMARVSSEGAITLHEPWHWPLLQDLWPLVATYVLPHDGIVLRLLSGLERRSDHSNLGRVFDLLRTGYEITWTPPMVTRTPDGVSLQVLRPPWCVLVDLTRGRGQGSCLDLSLLSAGVLEAVGESPLVIFLLDESGLPAHALIGTWRDSGHRFRPILRGEDVRRPVRKREILAADVTRVCRDRESEFRSAEAEAQDLIAGCIDIVAIDICALRPPHGGIAPFEISCDSTVLAAIAEAESAAREHSTSVVETLHLLYGLWWAGGAVAFRLLADIGWNREAALALCRSAMLKPTGPIRQGHTRGFERCLAEARENARSQGLTLTREGDLWWAVLGSRSASIDRAFAERAGLKEVFLAALSEISPASRPESSSR